MAKPWPRGYASAGPWWRNVGVLRLRNGQLPRARWEGAFQSALKLAPGTRP